MKTRTLPLSIAMNAPVKDGVSSRIIRPSKTWAEGSIGLRILIIVSLICWIYSPAWSAPMGGDDALYLTQNPLLHDPWRLWKVWFSPGSFVEYYPITQTVQWLEWQLWGESPPGYHWVNLALHATGALLVWKLLAKFELRWAWMGGLFFAIHPMQVESVAWISELKNVLSLPPFLMAACAYLDYVRQGRDRDYRMALAWFVLAMLCKISVMMFPVVLLLLIWSQRRHLPLRAILETTPFFFVAVVLGAITLLAGSHYRLVEHQPPDDVALGGLASRFALAGLVASHYFASLFWPWRPLVMYPQWTIDPPAAWQVLPWLALGTIVFCCWLRRRSWGRHGLLGLGFFLINLLPVLGFIPISYMDHTWAMDHFLYVPMIGLIALIVAAAEQAVQRLPLLLARWGGVAAVGLLVALAWESHTYAGIFSNREVSARYVLQHHPNAWLAREELGDELLKQGRVDDAIAQFTASLQLKPDYIVTHYRLGTAYNHANRLPEAAAQFEEAIRLFPDYVDAQDDLGALLVQQGKVEEGIAHFQRALATRPNFAQAQNDWANALVQQGKFDEAVTHYRAAINLNPKVAELHLNLGLALLRSGRASEAIPEFESTLRLDPTEPTARSALDRLRGGAQK